MKKLGLLLTGLFISLFSFSQINSQAPTVNGNFLRAKAWYNLYIPHGPAGPRMFGGVDSTSLIWHNLGTGRVAIYQGKGMWNYLALLKDVNYDNLMNKPKLFSGVYDSLKNKPVIITPVNADWNATEGLAKILNKPTLFNGDYNSLLNRPVLFNGDYLNLVNKPVIPTDNSQLANGSKFITENQAITLNGDVSGTGKTSIPVTVNMFNGQLPAYYLNYNNLTNKPTIPTVPTKVSQFTNDANYISTEALFIASPAYGITSINISNWNTAYSWGNHAGLYRPITYVPSWAEVTGKPTTVAGYGITDTYTQSQINTLLAAKQNTLTFDNTPTAGSNNPVTSNGIKAADDLKEALANKVTTYSNTNTSTTQYPSMAALNAGLSTKLSSANSFLIATVLSSTLSISAGATSTVTVTFPSALPDNNYGIFPVIEVPTSLLGTLVVVGPISSTKTTTSCQVQIKNTGILAITVGSSQLITQIFRTSTTN